MTSPRARAQALRPAPRIAGFESPEQVHINDVVYDRDYEMPATVRDVQGQFVELLRPTGLSWRCHYRRVRPASEWEHRQLAAVGRLHQQRQKGRS
jgi:hypothetical protein